MSADYSTKIIFKSLDFLGLPYHVVASNGEVWSFCNARWGMREKGRKMKPGKTPRGYLQIHSRKWKRPYYVHELVLLAFVGPRPKGREARHFPDRNPANNNLDNLSWGTREQNSADRRIHGTEYCGTKCKIAKLSEEDVFEIWRLHFQGMSNPEIAKRFPVDRTTIHGIVTRQIWRHLLPFVNSELRMNNLLP